MKRIAAIALIIFVMSSDMADCQPAELLFGSVAMDIPAEMHKRLKPLTEYLSNEIGIPVRLHLSPNMKVAIDKVASGKVDIAYLTPVAYLESHEKGGTRLIAKTVTKGKASFQLMIVVKADSEFKSTLDLKGKAFAFGDKKALLQRAVVVGSGIKLEEFGSYTFIGHYDNIARGVSVGDFDAGILKDTKAFAWESKGLRILYASEHLPPYNIAAKKGLDEKIFEKIKKAFINLNVSNPEHKKVIKALSKKYDGFAVTSNDEYDVVRKLVRPFRVYK